MTKYAFFFLIKTSTIFMFFFLSQLCFNTASVQFKIQFGSLLLFLKGELNRLTEL